MGLIREPLDVDFVIGSRRATQKELDEISACIANLKLKTAKPNTSVKRVSIPTLQKKKVIA